MDNDELVTEISRVLCEVLRANECLSGCEVGALLSASSLPPLTPFDGPRAPAYPVDRYLQRIARYTYCGSTCLLAALIYIDRAAMKEPDMKITSRNIHRLLITSVVVAMKFWSDQFFDNEYYARVGGIPSRELCSLEVWLLRLLDFDLVVEESLYDEYRTMLANRCRTAASAPVAIPTPSQQLAHSAGSGSSPAARHMAMSVASLNSGSSSMVAGSVPMRTPVICAFDALAGSIDGPSPSSSPMRCYISRRFSPPAVSS